VCQCEFRALIYAQLLKYYRGFISVRGSSPWWKYSTLYSGTVISNVDRISQVKLSASGALFALINPQLTYSVERNSCADERL